MLLRNYGDMLNLYDESRGFGYAHCSQAQPADLDQGGERLAEGRVGGAGGDDVHQHQDEGGRAEDN